MALRLRVVSIHAQLLGEDGTRVFGVHGGSIGRSGDNDWVLPDPDRYVSGHHARVDYRNGQYVFTDTSSNGTYLNDSDAPLSNSGPHVLKDGDRLRLGDYELTVDLDVGAGISAEPSRAIENDIGASLDLGSLLTTSGSRAAPVNAYGQAVEMPGISSAQTPLEPRQRIPAREKKLPESNGEVPWNLSTRRRAEPHRSTSRSSPVAPPPTRSPEAESARSAETPTADPLNGLNELCRGTGIDPSSIPPPYSRSRQIAGRSSAKIDGLMELTQSAASQACIAQDTIQPSENNPLAGRIESAAGCSAAEAAICRSRVRESFRYAPASAATAAPCMRIRRFRGRLIPADLRERSIAV
jgi:type VI secretion system protein